MNGPLASSEKIVARHLQIILKNLFQVEYLREDFLVKTDDEVRRSILGAIKKIDRDAIQGKEVEF